MHLRQPWMFSWWVICIVECLKLVAMFLCCDGKFFGGFKIRWSSRRKVGVSRWNWKLQSEKPATILRNLLRLETLFQMQISPRQFSNYSSHISVPTNQWVTSTKIRFRFRWLFAPVTVLINFDNCNSRPQKSFRTSRWTFNYHRKLNRLSQGFWRDSRRTSVDLNPWNPSRWNETSPQVYAIGKNEFFDSSMTRWGKFWSYATIIPCFGCTSIAEDANNADF